MALIEKLNAIGDAIREKTGGTDKLTLDGMVEAIAGIESGGADISPAERFYAKLITPTENTSELSLLGLTQTSETVCLAAVCVYNTNGVTLSSTHVRAALFTSGGWAVRLSRTGSTETSRPTLTNGSLNFGSGVLAAGVTYFAICATLSK